MSDKSVLIGISGGIDSAVAAYLLQRRGYRVEGLYIDNGFPSRGEDAAARVAETLSIPLHRLDISTRFRKEIVQYFFDEYCLARTPNPCVVCNKKIKFACLLDEAENRGLEYIATGHYARIDDPGGGNSLRLRSGKDRTKDQTYFLFMLGQAELARLLLPLGDLSKTDVKKIGAEIRLSETAERESQEICFIPDDDYKRFIEGKHDFPQGDIVTTDGKIVGKHRGIHSLTVGQRRGLNIASERPYYVVEIRKEANQVIVGREEDQYFSGLVARQALWISPDYPESGCLRTRTFIRYRHRGVESDVLIAGDGTVTVSFDTPQKAVAPGQAAVFYEGDILIGGGWIERGLRHD
ncbi:MAG: tRNA 2-thiouridine(34) synthase MnmA [Deltaproteobacteria bacterium]|nr:tRNA 2-thiouridine(34) synthase MnmA [Deltaproteobacteria bacterium]MBN2687937.1 tRNA 2-thiouridine(34) synthase MnmA [Deltaproteobacteria bacterium]